MKGTYRGGIALAAALSACMTGCSYDTQCRVDSQVASVGGCPMDMTPPAAPATDAHGSGILPGPNPPPMPEPRKGPVSREEQNFVPGSPGQYTGPACQSSRANGRLSARGLLGAGACIERPPRTVEPLEIPSAIPGSAAPPLFLPPTKPGETPAERRECDRSTLCRIGSHQPRAGTVPRARPNAADACAVGSDRGNAAIRSFARRRPTWKQPAAI